jgi:REP element-mobilizing transposase RayT
MPRFQKTSDATPKFFDGKHRREHWYRDNTIYFLTTRCTNQFPAFKNPEAKEIFWRQFDKYSQEHDFQPWIVTLLDNHYHAIGYLPNGAHLGPFMRKLHGSTAKLVNDLLSERLLPFWNEYFDGCLRDEIQYRRAYRYTQRQAVRHRICADYRDYPHTRVYLDLEQGLAQALKLHVFLPEVPYKRYT